MKASRWLDIESPDWIEVLKGVKHDVYHLPEYVAIEASRLDGLPKLFVYEEQDSRFVLPLVFRNIDHTDGRDATSPYGYPGPLVSAGAEVGFLERAFRSLVGALSDLGLVSAFVRLHPLLSPQPKRWAQPGVLVQHGRTVAVDLRQSEAQMWAEVRTRFRSYIIRGREQGHCFSIDPHWNDLEDFLSIYAESMAKVGAAPEYFFNRAYHEGLRDLSGARTYLATVRIEGEPAAAAVFTEVGGLVQYHLSGAREAFRRQQPTKFLLDQVRRWAAKSGCHTLHLGGGLGGREDSLYNFKAGFSKRRHDFFTWRLVLDPAGYEKLCLSVGVDTEEDYFPAYRQTG